MHTFVEWFILRYKFYLIVSPGRLYINTHYLYRVLQHCFKGQSMLIKAKRLLDTKKGLSRVFVTFYLSNKL